MKNVEIVSIISKRNQHLPTSTVKLLIPQKWHMYRVNFPVVHRQLGSTVGSVGTELIS